VPHYLFSNQDYRWYNAAHEGWSTALFEYDKALPHVIILSAHFNPVGYGHILHGELKLIITAMNARAKQPLVEGEDDGVNFLFGLEKRFPVRMLHDCPQVLIKLMC
jgi:hypothetical protein